jgi:hypothetical protein
MKTGTVLKRFVGFLVVLNLLALGVSLVPSEAEAEFANRDWYCVVGSGGEPEYGGCMNAPFNSCDSFEQCGPITN